MQKSNHEGPAAAPAAAQLHRAKAKEEQLARALKRNLQRRKQAVASCEPDA